MNPLVLWWIRESVGLWSCKRQLRLVFTSFPQRMENAFLGMDFSHRKSISGNGLFPLEIHFWEWTFSVENPFLGMDFSIWKIIFFGMDFSHRKFISGNGLFPFGNPFLWMDFSRWKSISWNGLFPWKFHFGNVNWWIRWIRESVRWIRWVLVNPWIRKVNPLSVGWIRESVEVNPWIRWKNMKPKAFGESVIPLRTLF